MMMVSSSVLWIMTCFGIAQDSAVIEAPYRLDFGSPSFSVPFGLLLAGISVTAGYSRLLPKWLAVFGVLIAVVGELSWVDILFPKALLLIPLTRFPGFVWLMAAGFWLPRTIANERAQTAA